MINISVIVLGDSLSKPLPAHPGHVHTTEWPAVALSVYVIFHTWERKTHLILKMYGKLVLWLFYLLFLKWIHLLLVTLPLHVNTWGKGRGDLILNRPQSILEKFDEVAGGGSLLINLEEIGFEGSTFTLFKTVDVASFFLGGSNLPLLKLKQTHSQQNKVFFRSKFIPIYRMTS